MRSIRLKSGCVGRYDAPSPFVVESGELELKIELPAKSGEFYFVSELNGKNGGAKLIPKSGVIALDGLEAGELRVEVRHYLRGELLETFKVEPLLLKGVDTMLSTTPEIALLTGEIAVLNEEKERLANALDGVNMRLKTAEGCVAELYAFAYAVYENSPLLNGRGLSFEAFKEALKNENFKEKL